MKRQSLLKALQNHESHDEEEASSLRELMSFVEKTPDCFERVHHAGGHVTGSGLLISRDGQRVLLNHHKGLNIWMQFGGHADGEGDIQNVARRETIEESGIAAIEDIGGGLMDVDIHVIPANDVKGEPEHKHYDVRYLFRVTDDSDFVLSDESNELRWCSYEEAYEMTNSDEIRRLLRKWQGWLQQ